VPVSPQVNAFCELLGFDPLYVANEGKVVMVVDQGSARKVIEILKRSEHGAGARVIGQITDQYPGKAWIQTAIGGKRILDMLAGEQLPRIC
jgi:hydrogenase expression/formation protein HypE